MSIFSFMLIFSTVIFEGIIKSSPLPVKSCYIKKYELLKEDLRSMSFEDETFDSINFANGYHTLDGIERGMKEISRVLKKDGTLYINILLKPKDKLLDGISRWINRYGMKTGILKRPYTLEECMKIPSQYNLEIIEAKTYQNCLYLKTKKI